MCIYILNCNYEIKLVVCYANKYFLFVFFAHKHVHLGTELHAKSNDTFVQMGPSLSRIFLFPLVALLVIIFYDDRAKDKLIQPFLQYRLFSGN